ncbi:methionine adenosyltransferase [Candidatus Gracilibacteria bacterium]|nr:methionine adenosyltransferase [Candidatus Gracilibacteria bacterium]
MKHFITSESVTEGHPDKMCDQISDSVLDACLAQDPNSRVACESLLTTGKAIVSGEITTTANVDFEKVIRDTIVHIGYDSEEKFFDGEKCDVQILLHKQSPDIAMGVDTGGAGDQGIMYGYATNETDSYLPITIDLAHKLARQLAKVRKDGTLDYIWPDGKTQVTVEYDGNKFVRIDTIVVSSQHSDKVTQEKLREDIKEFVINPIVGSMVDENTKYFINPTGNFHIGGPAGDTGLTGRKIIVDTYGGIGRHGGGAFSGKDPSKVDRSAAYIARYLAKNIVASEVCDRCEIQLGYAIGVVQPLSIYLDCFGTEKVDIERIVDVIKKNFDLSPKGIIEKLDLKRPIFQATAAYGHFGRDEFSWESLDSVEVFKNLL